MGKFVEFFGPGVSCLSIADRATISNMCPEYGATVGYFPVDDKSIDYLRQTNRDPKKVATIEAYMKASGMLRDFSNASQDPVFSEVHELDLASVVPSLSGPKRPHDRVSVSDMKTDFRSCLSANVGFKGFAIPQDKLATSVPFMLDGREHVLRHGSVLIAAITSCTNTSNPSVMLGAGLLAKKAVEKGLTVAPYIKTSLSPGSGVVTYYLRYFTASKDMGLTLFNFQGVRRDPLPGDTRLLCRWLRLYDLYRQLWPARRECLRGGEEGRPRLLRSALREQELRGQDPSRHQSKLPRLAASRHCLRIGRYV